MQPLCIIVFRGSASALDIWAHNLDERSQEPAAAFLVIGHP
jgi:hypothetical protein